MSHSYLSVFPFKSRAFAAAAGATGGLFSFWIGEIVGAFTDMDGAGATSYLEVFWHSALWAGAIGAVIGAAILVYDNAQSLRGRWNRDLGRALPLFFAISFVGGAAGQLAYLVVQNSLTRGIGWALMGAGVGLGIGVLRRDFRQSARGALGGFIGGFIGGFVFDFLALISSAGGGSLSRLVGQIVLGALIALLMRVVQDALKSAWLLGISAGPYEGKEYPLNTSRVSVGRASTNDIALFREESGPPQLGALVFENGKWWWQGEAVAINDVPQTRAQLASGDALQLGTYRFRFNTRRAKIPIETAPDLSSTNAPVVSSTNTAAAPVLSSTPIVVPTPTVSSTLAAVSSPNASTVSSTKLAVPIPSTPVVFSKPPVSTPPPTPVPVAAPEWVLLLPNGEQFRVAPGASFEIGRNAQNGLVLVDESVSGRHAHLQFTAETLEIRDLKSTNGTFVNGARLMPETATTLRNGDRLRLGKSELVVLRLNA